MTWPRIFIAVIGFYLGIIIADLLVLPLLFLLGMRGSLYLTALLLLLSGLGFPALVSLPGFLLFQVLQGFTYQQFRLLSRLYFRQKGQPDKHHVKSMLGGYLG